MDLPGGPSSLRPCSVALLGWGPLRQGLFNVACRAGYMSDYHVGLTRRGVVVKMTCVGWSARLSVAAVGAYHAGLTTRGDIPGGH